MDQQVKYINVADLVLWTENPRDPVDETATDQEMVDRALMDNGSKWNLSKLAREMGEYYDFSELPTVVYHGEKPVVYDGNRRVILGKLKLGVVESRDGTSVKIPDFPKEMPCNVCVKEVALSNVLRKHSDTGSWQLSSEIFFYISIWVKQKVCFSLWMMQRV